MDEDPDFPGMTLEQVAELKEFAREQGRQLAAQVGIVLHNHMTRDFKPRGQCPACDAYWDRHG
jgi:hypothetical protein